MNPSYEELDASHVLTLEEITNLTEEGGKPADTLMNVVALIATRFKTDVCSAYLLEPDRSNLVLAATLGLHPRLHRHPAHGAPRRPRRPGRRTGSSRRRRRRDKSSALQILQRVRRRGLPLLPRRSPHRSRHAAGRARRADQGAAHLSRREIRMLAEAADQVAPVVSEARTLDRFIAPAQERLWSLARNLWWSWDHDCVSLFRDLNPARWRQLNQNPICAAHGDAAGRNRAPRHRTRAAQPHQLRLPPPAGVSARRPHLGRDQRRRSAAAPGRLLLRRIRPARIASRSIPAASASSPAITSRAPPTSTFRSSASASSTVRDTSGSASTRTAGSRKNISRPTSASCPWSPPSAQNGEPVVDRDRNARRLHPRQGLASQGRPLRSPAARLQRRRQCPRRSSNSPRASTAVTAALRIRQELLLGVGGFRALKAMGITPGVLHLNEGHSGFAVFEAIRSRMEEEGLDFDQPLPARSRAKSSSPRTHPCPPATTASAPISSKSTSDPCASNSASRTTS